MLDLTPIQLKLAAGLFLIVMALGFVFTYTHAIERAQKAEAEILTLKEDLKASEEANNKLKQENKETNETLTEKIKHENELLKAVALFRKAIAKLRTTDPQAAAWLDTSIPSSIISIMQQPADRDESGVCAPTGGPNCTH